MQSTDAQCFNVVPGGPAIREEPDWIWLPNSLVDGAEAEVPPVERIRQTQNTTALRIFVDLYHSHDLAAESGLNWRPSDGFRQEYDRLSV